ncbi:TIM barrel protein [Nocardia sp. NPDC059180]|uniref:TIM barrel protein n=1 Tax=Nocardia sp. NPDC059180 TaxID=3346761 RepID=UPI0036BCBA65
MTADLELACTVRPWAQFALPRALAGIRAAGYTAVALPVHGVTEVITPVTSPTAAAEIGAVIADHGLRLVMLAHAADLDRGDTHAFETLCRQLDHCMRLGVSTLIDMGCAEPAHNDRYLRLMAAAAPYAEAHGVTIAVKPHGGLTRTAADTLSVVERVGHPAFRICWDPGNLVHYGGEPPARGLGEVVPYIHAVGIRDHPALARYRAVSGAMPPAITPGDGIVDFAELYRALAAHGFSGPSAVESVTKLGTAGELESEASRARLNVLDAMAGHPPSLPRREPMVRGQRSCSVIARAADEDPIGTARPFDRFLMLELPLPWPPGMGTPVWETDRVAAPLRAALRTATQRTQECGLTMKTFAAAPDPEYSVPGLMRVIRFDRRPGAAAPFERIEHHVPQDLAPELITALFDDDRDQLTGFARYRIHGEHRDLVVCTHASVDGCCGTRGYPFYERLRRFGGSSDAVRVWRVSSFGGHRFAPTLVDFPDGRYWGNLGPELIPQLVDRTGHPADLMGSYRGWSALRDPREQVIERELFRGYGWDWITHQLSLESDTDMRYLATVHDGRSGSTDRHVVEVRDLGTHPVLVGCDRTAGERPHYTAALVTDP